jgi:hypothetical protein
MGIANTDQPSFLKESQLELCAAAFDWISETCATFSWLSAMLATALRELIKARGCFAKGQAPLNYETFLPKVRETFDAEFFRVMARAHVVQFQPGKLWLRFKTMQDELAAYWKKRELRELLTAVYGCDFSLKVGQRKT